MYNAYPVNHVLTRFYLTRIVYNPDNNKYYLDVWDINNKHWIPVTRHNTIASVYQKINTLDSSVLVIAGDIIAA